MKTIIIASKRGKKISDSLNAINMKHDCFLFKKRPVFNNIIYPIKILRLLLTYRKECIIITDTPGYIGLLVWLISRVFNVEYIYRARGDAYRELTSSKRFFHRWFYINYFISNPKMCICVSKYLANVIQEQTNSRVVYIHPPQATPKSFLPFEQRKKHILIVSNFGYYEKIKPILEGLVQLDKLLGVNNQYQLNILGAGKELPKLKERITTLKNKNRIKVLGHVKNVEEYYQTSLVLVHLSGLDAYSSIINESRACGLPVIANAVGGVTEQIIDGTDGFIIEDTQSTKLEEVFNELQKSDVWKQISETGLKKVKFEKNFHKNGLDFSEYL